MATKTNFTVTQNGITFKDYKFDEKTKTFSTTANNLVIDFGDTSCITFKTGDNCTFKTGGNCTFKTGDNCTFKTGDNCTFNTGWNCTFKTGDYCTFKTGDYCTLTFKNRFYNFGYTENMNMIIMERYIHSHVNRNVESIKSHNKFPEFVEYSKNIQLEMNTRMRTVAGMCLYHRISKNIKLKFSTYVLSPLTDGEVYEIVAHEMAHAIQFFYTGQSNHDDEFYSYGKFLNVKLNRTHDHEVLKNVVKRFKTLYLPTGKVYSFSTTIFNKIKNDTDYKLVCVNTFRGKTLIKSQTIL
jgi:predicted SprT family Zn-dependent metalloprotease/uncharacterized protein YodC (DUF2158 family)